MSQCSRFPHRKLSALTNYNRHLFSKQQAYTQHKECFRNCDTPIADPDLNTTEPLHVFGVNWSNRPGHRFAWMILPSPAFVVFELPSQTLLCTLMSPSKTTLEPCWRTFSCCAPRFSRMATSESAHDPGR